MPGASAEVVAVEGLPVAAVAVPLVLMFAINATMLLNAALLNVFYLGLGFAIFLAVFRIARHRGLLLNIGE